LTVISLSLSFPWISAAQERLVAYREESVQRNKVVFPALQTTKSRGGPAATGGPGSGSGMKGQGQGGKKSYKVSADVAPPTMFQRDAGFLPMEIAQVNNFAAPRVRVQKQSSFKTLLALLLFVVCCCCCCCC
jgi:hypothetical protein